MRYAGSTGGWGGGIARVRNPVAKRLVCERVCVALGVLLARVPNVVEVKGAGVKGVFVAVAIGVSLAEAKEGTCDGGARPRQSTHRYAGLVGRRIRVVLSDAERQRIGLKGREEVRDRARRRRCCRTGGRGLLKDRHARITERRVERRQVRQVGTRLKHDLLEHHPEISRESN